MGRVNNQLDYTQESSMKFFAEEEEAAVERLKVKAGVTLDKKIVDFARHFFNIFDGDHLGRLSISDCQRAVTYAFMNDNIAPDPKIVRDIFLHVMEQRDSTEGVEDYCLTTAKKSQDRLNFPEFLHLLYVLDQIFGSKRVS